MKYKKIFALIYFGINLHYIEHFGNVKVTNSTGSKNTPDIKLTEVRRYVSIYLKYNSFCMLCRIIKKERTQF